MKKCFFSKLFFFLFFIINKLKFIVNKTENINQLCPKIHTAILEKNECFFQQSDSSDEILISECAQSEKCVKGKCEKYTKNEKLPSYPGGSCISNNDCLFNNECVNGKCSGSKLGEKCQSTENCLFGLYCSENYCIYPKTENTRCSKTEQCVFPLICYEGVCKEIFSLENGIKINEENRFLCKSGHVYNGECNSFKKITTYCGFGENNKCLYSNANGEIFELDNMCQCDYDINKINRNDYKCLEGDIDNEVYSQLEKILKKSMFNEDYTNYCNLVENRFGYCREILKNSWEARIEQYNLEKYLIEEKYNSLLPQDSNSKNTILNTFFSFDYTMEKQNIIQCPKFEYSHNKFSKNEENNLVCAKLENPFYENGKNISILINGKQCPENHICQYDFNKISINQNYNFKCEPIYNIENNNQISNKYPGESCTKNDLCLKGNFNDAGECVKGNCTGHNLNQKCISNTDCIVGLFCDTEKKICINQKKVNDDCKSSFECLNNLICVNNKCVEYYSMEIGESINEVKEEINKNKLCKTGVYNEKTNKCDNFISYYNIPNEKISNGFVKCDINNECLYSSDNGKTIYNKKCECGYNSEGNSFCPLSHDYNNKEWEELFKLRKYIYRNDCHTENRKNCINNEIVEKIGKLEIKTEKAHLFNEANKEILLTMTSKTINQTEGDDEYSYCSYLKFKYFIFYLMTLLLI